MLVYEYDGIVQSYNDGKTTLMSSKEYREKAYKLTLHKREFVPNLDLWNDDDFLNFIKNPSQYVQESSPLIDAGFDGSPGAYGSNIFPKGIRQITLPESDMLGKNRIIGKNPDIGPIEFTPSLLPITNFFSIFPILSFPRS